MVVSQDGSMGVIQQWKLVPCKLPRTAYTNFNGDPV